MPHSLGQNSCPAKRKSCHHCGELNHYARCCRARQQTTRDNATRYQGKERQQVNQVEVRYQEGKHNPVDYISRHPVQLPGAAQSDIANDYVNLILDTTPTFPKAMKLEDVAKSTKLKLPLNMSPLPPTPWSELSIDLCGPFPSGHYLLVVIDDYSRYPEVEIVSSTAATAIVPKLDRIFSSFGIPTKVRTDNGPPFNGQEFHKFFEHLGIAHRRVMPLWPKANGEAERFMQSLTKTVQTAHVSNQNWKQNLYGFLRSYRATPHPSTQKSPAEVMFGRKMKTTLPEVPVITKEQTDIRLQDNKAKERMKMSQRTILRHTLPKEKDTVIVRQTKRNKLTPHYNPEPYVVTKQKGPMITARQLKGHHYVTRHASFFKVIPTEASAAEDKKHPPHKLQTPKKPRPQEAGVKPQQPARRELHRSRRAPRRLIEET